MRVLGTPHLSYGRLAPAGMRRRLLGAGLVLSLVGGCAAPPPPPPKPVVSPIAMTFVAAADVNPDARGRASPLTVRVYALKTSNAFEGADFFSLYDKDLATLGADVVQREEMLLRPGDSKKIDMVLPADAKAVGVVAAYRDLERARWRELRVVEPGKGQTLTIGLEARQIRIVPQ